MLLSQWMGLGGGGEARRRNKCTAYAACWSESHVNGSNEMWVPVILIWELLFPSWDDLERSFDHYNILAGYKYRLWSQTAWGQILVASLTAWVTSGNSWAFMPCSLRHRRDHTHEDLLREIEELTTRLQALRQDLTHSANMTWPRVLMDHLSFSTYLWEFNIDNGILYQYSLPGI